MAAKLTGVRPGQIEILNDLLRQTYNLDAFYGGPRNEIIEGIIGKRRLGEITDEEAGKLIAALIELRDQQSRIRG